LVSAFSKLRVSLSTLRLPSAAPTLTWLQPVVAAALARQVRGESHRRVDREVDLVEARAHARQQVLATVLWRGGWSRHEFEDRAVDLLPANAADPERRLAEGRAVRGDRMKRIEARHDLVPAARAADRADLVGVHHRRALPVRG